LIEAATFFGLSAIECQRFQIVLPSRPLARTISLRAATPGVFSGQPFALRRAGMTAQALRAAMASWQAFVS